MKNKPCPAKVNPLIDLPYLEWLRQQPCSACGRQPLSQAAHTGARYVAGKPGRGMGQKTDDKDAISLCVWCHLLDPDSYHSLENEAKFEKAHNIDLRVVISDLRSKFRSEKENAE